MTNKLIFKSIFDEDDKTPIKDGTAVRVPMMMMDAQQRAVKDHLDMLCDGPRRPHQLSFTDAQTKEREASQRAYDKRVSDAWRSPPPVAATPTTAPRVESPFASDATRAYDKRISEAWRNAR